MRENRQSGSEGGEAELNRSSLPLSVFQQAASSIHRRIERHVLQVQH